MGPVEMEAEAQMERQLLTEAMVQAEHMMEVRMIRVAQVVVVRVLRVMVGLLVLQLEVTVEAETEVLVVLVLYKLMETAFLAPMETMVLL
jgi:hypothetical protein